jgi:hypothetical protein
MATNIQYPAIGQIVLYNNAGTTVPGIIYSVNQSTWTVSLVYFGSGGPTSATGVDYDPINFDASEWRYMNIF